MDFETVIDQHVAWKLKFRMAIRRKEKLDAEKICRDDACELGKWIYGEGERHSSLPVFTEMKDYHEQFHVCAGAIAEVINKEYFDEATKMLENKKPFSYASLKVIGSALDLQKALRVE